jgi:hypothetical protein
MSPKKGVHILGCGYEGVLNEKEDDQNVHGDERSKWDKDRQVGLLKDALHGAGLSEEEAEKYAPGVLEQLQKML